MNRKEVSEMIDKLLWLKVISDGSDDAKEEHVIDSAISLIMELSSEVYDQQLDNESLKQEILHLEAMIED